MELLVQQTKKDLYSAEFNICDKSTNNLLGYLSENPR